MPAEFIFRQASPEENQCSVSNAFLVLFFFLGKKKKEEKFKKKFNKDNNWMCKYSPNVVCLFLFFKQL